MLWSDGQRRGDGGGGKILSQRKQPATGFSQTVCGTRCTIASDAWELVSRKSKGSAWYWKQFDVLQGEHMKAKPRFKRCNCELKPANLANSNFDNDQCCHEWRRNDDKIGALVGSSSGTAADVCNGRLVVQVSFQDISIVG
eukprot:356239-Chlamydomonas_euryale.AAC.2